jgi:hypothetical protein
MIGIKVCTSINFTNYPISERLNNVMYSENIDMWNFNDKFITTRNRTNLYRIEL